MLNKLSLKTSHPPYDIREINYRFYNALWSNSKLERPERFNTWPMISELLPDSPDRLEIGPGLRPRLPIKGTHFIDISSTAITRLNAGGGTAHCGEIGDLPFSDRQFDLVCAFDVVEHVNDDRQAFAELSRVLKDGGVLIFSVPLHSHLWSEFDEWSGHARRYDPEDLLAVMEQYRLTPEKSAVFGMQPSNPGLLNLGMWFLKHNRRVAMFFYNWVFMPLGMRFQKQLNIESGLLDANGADEIVIICRRGSRSHPFCGHDIKLDGS